MGRPVSEIPFDEYASAIESGEITAEQVQAELDRCRRLADMVEMQLDPEWAKKPMDQQWREVCRRADTPDLPMPPEILKRAHAN